MQGNQSDIDDGRDVVQRGCGDASMLRHTIDETDGAGL